MPKPKKKPPVAAAPANKRRSVTRPPVIKGNQPQLESAQAKWYQRLAAWLHQPRIAGIFALVSVGVLFVTTVFWSLLSALLHQANADQLIDAYLFESPNTFSEALFPGAHTFLIKWPIFALMQLFGQQSTGFVITTILMVVATIAVLVYILHKIEPRPLVFGVLCLSLASVLLLIPAQPYPGALLPANLAMTTTRNLEYALFIWCIYMLTKVRAVKSKLFWGLTGLLTLVIASDKLFAVLAIGSALIVLAGYVGVLRRRYDLALAGRWLLMGVLAFGLANLLLLAITRLGLTNVIDEASASPFALITSLKQLSEGLFFAASAVLTNFGANPVHYVVIVRDMPGELLRSLLSPTILAYVFNFAVLIAGLWAVANVVWTRTADAATRLTVILTGSFIASVAVFVLTDHYYPVDARYIAIGLFTLFVALATYLRGRQFRTGYIMAVVAVLMLVLPLGMLRAWQEFSAGEKVMAVKNTITRAAAANLDKNGITRLLGGYWDVTPVKAQAFRPVTIAPVDNCVQPRRVLNSLAWFQLPDSTPSAYMATRDPGKNTYDGCSLPRLATLYGTPSERITLAKSPDAPYEADSLLLLYPDGIKPLATQKPAAQPQTTLAAPTIRPLRDNARCAESSMNIIAHQDDDLLFMNPDVSDDIRSGRCVRTVYLTAGDSGQPFGYWNSRELGAKAAYAAMYEAPNIWRDQRELLDGRFLTVSYLEGAPEVALVFMRLPDGNLRGEGFAATKYESLQRLIAGSASEVYSVDDGTAITKDQLAAVLAGLMTADRPDQIRTLGSDDISDGDHSDHRAAGELTRLARAQYVETHRIEAYEGYSTKLQPVNLFNEQAISKELTFLTYAKYDGAVCQTAIECRQTYTYGSYLTRKYTVEKPPVLSEEPIQTMP